MAERDLRPVGDTQVLASVSNAARLLKEFGKGDREIGVSELARRLGIGKSTTHRLLHTLTVERLLEQDTETGSLPSRPHHARARRERPGLDGPAHRREPRHRAAART